VSPVAATGLTLANPPSLEESREADGAASRRIASDQRMPCFESVRIAFAFSGVSMKSGPV
jgi:hypothetical protein